MSNRNVHTVHNEKGWTNRVGQIDMKTQIEH